MEKLIVHVTYWLGIACLVVAVIWRIVNTFRLWQSPTGAGGGPLGHGAFVHASIAFLVAATATVAYSWFNSQES